MAKKHHSADELEAPEAPAVGAEGPAITLLAPLEVKCHEDFLVTWTAENATEVIFAGIGVVTKSPVIMRANEGGMKCITASAKFADGTTASALTSVKVL